MDNQPPAPQQPLPEQQTPSNISWLKTLSIGFSLVSFGIAIGIGGYILAAQKTKPVPQNQQIISPTPLPSPIVDPTENWKTYSFNNEFSFKYLPDWKAGDMETICCSFVSNPSAIYPSHSEGTLSIEGIYNQKGCIEGSLEQLSGNLNSKESKVIFAGQQARVFESESKIGIDENLPIGYSKKIIVGKGNACYTITYLSISSNFKQREIFDQILSTFRFTEQK